MLVLSRTELTFWHSKCGHDGFNQTEHKEGAATHVGQEEHDANAATKFRTQRPAYHVWVMLRTNSKLACCIHYKKI